MAEKWPKPKYFHPKILMDVCYRFDGFLLQILGCEYIKHILLYFQCVFRCILVYFGTFGKISVYSVSFRSVCINTEKYRNTPKYTEMSEIHQNVQSFIFTVKMYIIYSGRIH